MNSSYNKSNIIYNKNNKILTNQNHNTINSFSINGNYNTIEGNYKDQNYSIRKKIEMMKIEKNNNELSSTNTKLNSNKKTSGSDNNSGCNINFYNKLGNNTISNIFKYNKLIIRKPKTRNYITVLGKNKSSFNYLNNQNSFENNSSNNNNFQSLNSLNTQSNCRGKVKKILKINRNNKNLNISSHQINLDNNDNNNNIKGKSSNGKKIEEYNRISINAVKYKNYKISNPYKKVSPYKKPESICGSTNILKGIKNNIGKINKMDNFKTIQTQRRVSNVKTNWSKKKIKKINK